MSKKEASSSGSWNCLAVLVGVSVDARGRVSERAERARELLLLAAQSASAESGLFTVITRSELEAKGGKDAKSLANALKQWIKQDKVKVLARKQKLAKAAEGNTTTTQETTCEGNDPVEQEDASLANEIQKHLSTDESMRAIPSEDDLVLAQQLLQINDEEAKPDKVYLLKDFPATVEEAALLVPTSTSEGLLDAVVELVGMEDDSEEDRAQSRVSQTSTASAVISRPGVGEDITQAQLALSSSLPVLPPLATGSRRSKRLLHSKQEMLNARAKQFVFECPKSEKDLINNLKRAQVNATGPGWKDVAFLELSLQAQDSEITNQMPALLVLKRFTELIYHVGIEKYRFLKYLSSCKRVSIPKTSKPIDTDLFNLYKTTVMNATDNEAQRSVALILACAVQSIESNLAHEASSGEHALLKDEQQVDEEKEDYDREGKGNEEYTVEYGDSVLLKKVLAGESLDNRKHMDSLRVEYSYWSRVLVPGGKGRQWMPRWPTLSAAETGTLKTQLKLFQTLEQHRVEYSKRLTAFERLLNSVDNAPEKGWDLSDRVYSRNLSQHVACQVIGEAIAAEPKIYTKYVEEEDELLLVLHQQTPKGRQCKSVRSPFHATNLRPTLSDWPSIDIRVRRCIFDVDSSLVGQLEQTCHTLFPSDKSIIRLESLKNSDKAWCTVVKDGCYFGMRSNTKTGAAEAAFFASFEDESFVEVSRGVTIDGKPDGFPTMLAKFSNANGLHVTHGSDGSIRMQIPGDEVEADRVILGNGSAVCFLNDGTRRILYPNGDLSEVSETGETIVTYSFLDGGRQVVEKRTNQKHGSGKKSVALQLENTDVKTTRIAVERMLDPESGATVLIRKVDGTVLICHKDGHRLIKFKDGTNIVHTQNGEVVRIEKSKLPSVKLYLNAEAVAAKHSRGGRVDISRGGKTVRSTTLLPDATIIHIEYDTRVTAKVNGHLRIIKPDGTAIEAQDSGQVTLRPWNVDAEQRARRQAIIEMEEHKNLHQDAREEPDRNLACFLFHCDQASLSMRDWESNEFRVDKITSRDQRSVSVTLSGEFDPVQAVINAPLEPRLFVLDGSGRASELLTEAQVELARKRMELVCRGQFVPVSCSAIPLPSDLVEKDEGKSDVKKGQSRRRKSSLALSSRSPLAKDNKPDPKSPKRNSTPKKREDARVVRLGGALKQLSISESLVPSVVRELGAAAAFSQRFGNNVSMDQFCKGFPTHTESSESKEKSWYVVDALSKMERISIEDRDKVNNAEAGFQAWKREAEELEGQFKVEDPRSELSLAEEKRIQQLILKERRKTIKLEQKQLAKLAGLEGSDTSARRTSRSNRSLSTTTTKTSTRRNSRDTTTTERHPNVLETLVFEESLDDESMLLNDEAAELEYTEENDVKLRPETPPLRNVPMNETKTFWDFSDQSSKETRQQSV